MSFSNRPAEGGDLSDADWSATPRESRGQAQRLPQGNASPRQSHGGTSTGTGPHSVAATAEGPRVPATAAPNASHAIPEGNAPRQPTGRASLAQRTPSVNQPAGEAGGRRHPSGAPQPSGTGQGRSQGGASNGRPPPPGTIRFDPPLLTGQSLPLPPNTAGFNPPLRDTGGSGVIPSGTGRSRGVPSGGGPSGRAPPGMFSSGTGPSRVVPSGVVHAGASSSRVLPIRPTPLRPVATRARPSVAGPSGAGPSGAGPSGAGPSGAGPSGAGTSSALAQGIEATDREMILRIHNNLVVHTRDGQPLPLQDNTAYSSLINNYNSRVHFRHPRIRTSISPIEPGTDYEEWWMSSVMSRPVTMYSPCFEVTPTSRWREDVAAMWQYLNQNYRLQNDNDLGELTDIQIYFTHDYSLTDISRIAASAIHFEPALEALAPEVVGRYGTSYMASNWLCSASLAPAGKSRSASIATIERAASIDEVARIMNGAAVESGVPGNYGWNFRKTIRNRRVVEFRKAPMCLNGTDVLGWAELAMTFVQSALRQGSSTALRRFASDLRGLRAFLDQAGMPAGVADPRRWEFLFANKRYNLAREPKVVHPRHYPLQLSAAMRNQLQRLVKADMDRIRGDGGVVLASS